LLLRPVETSELIVPSGGRMDSAAIDEIRASVRS